MKPEVLVPIIFQLQRQDGCHRYDLICRCRLRIITEVYAIFVVIGYDNNGL